MDQVIFCGIDGCLSEGKYDPYNLAQLAKIRHLIEQLSTHDIGFCLCSRHPQPYVEAMARILDINTPFIAENGAAVFAPETNEPIYTISDSKRDRLVKLRRKLSGESYIFEPGKEASISISWEGMAQMPLEDITEHQQFLAKRFMPFNLKWSSSDSAINVSLRRISKRSGAEHILAFLELEPINAFAIGRGSSDLKLLEVVEQAMCPANAKDAVKALCGTVASLPGPAGVAELLQGVLETVETS